MDSMSANDLLKKVRKIEIKTRALSHQILYNNASRSCRAAKGAKHPPLCAAAIHTSVSITGGCLSYDLTDVDRELQILSEKEVLRRIGSKKNGCFKIA